MVVLLLEKQSNFYQINANHFRESYLLPHFQFYGSVTRLDPLEGPLQNLTL